jgi:thiol-disulfide isomerase/thioredoxin
MPKRFIIIVFLLLFVTTSSFAFGERFGFRLGRMAKSVDISGFTWLNSSPQTPAELKGRVVLYVFLTFSCGNCQTTINYLNKWWEKYKNYDFEIVLINSPVFEFEKKPENIQAAIEKSKIKWPVVLDNDYVIWKKFSNQTRPAVFVADKNGGIVYSNAGKLRYQEIERVIQMLIKEEEKKIVLPKIEDEKRFVDVCFPYTPSLYCGYVKGVLSNDDGYLFDRSFNYSSPMRIPKDSIALIGKFIATKEYVQSEEDDSKLLLNFKATEVNLVLEPVGDAVELEVFYDGKLHKIIKVTNPTSYNLINSKRAEEGDILIKAKSGRFRAYLFTFSGKTARED